MVDIKHDSRRTKRARSAQRRRDRMRPGFSSRHDVSWEDVEPALERPPRFASAHRPGRGRSLKNRAR